MMKIIGGTLGLFIIVGFGGAIYDDAVSAKHAYQFDQISYSKFTKAMTEARPRHPNTHK